MRRLRYVFGLTLAAAVSSAQAQGLDWTIYSNDAGLRVDYPAAIFSVAAGAGAPPGRLFTTADGRAELHIFTVAYDGRTSPRQMLRRTFPSDPATLAYHRVTDRFYAVSKRARGKIAYRRCNFTRNPQPNIHCIELTYPAREKRAWDGIVTRVSLSLRPR